MSLFERINKASADATEKGKEYLKKSEEYYKLKIFQQLTSSISLLVKSLIIGGFLIIGLVFASVSAALAIGEALNSLALGYVIVAGAYIMLSIIIYIFRSYIDDKIISKLSKTFFD